MDQNDALATAFTNGQAAQFEEHMAAKTRTWGTLGLMGNATYQGELIAMPTPEKPYGEFFAFGYCDPVRERIFFGPGALHSFTEKDQETIAQILSLGIDKNGDLVEKIITALDANAYLNEVDPFAEHASDWAPFWETPEIMCYYCEKRIEFEWDEKEYTKEKPLAVKCPHCQSTNYLTSQTLVQFICVHVDFAPRVDEPV